MGVRCETEGCRCSRSQCTEIASVQNTHSLSGKILHFLGMTEILKEPSNYLHRTFSRWSASDNYPSNYVEMRHVTVEAERKKAEVLLMTSQRKHFA